MIYEIDFEHCLIDFYIEDHCAMSYDEFDDLYNEIKNNIKKGR